MIHDMEDMNKLQKSIDGYVNADFDEGTDLGSNREVIGVTGTDPNWRARCVRRGAALASGDPTVTTATACTHLKCATIARGPARPPSDPAATALLPRLLVRIAVAVEATPSRCGRGLSWSYARSRRASASTRRIRRGIEKMYYPSSRIASTTVRSKSRLLARAPANSAREWTDTTQPEPPSLPPPTASEASARGPGQRLWLPVRLLSSIDEPRIGETLFEPLQVTENGLAMTRNFRSTRKRRGYSRRRLVNRSFSDGATKRSLQPPSLNIKEDNGVSSAMKLASEAIGLAALGGNTPDKVLKERLDALAESYMIC
ncbi:hypothetical protein DL767_007441 [Monosporascus sp. MG133]|nr:hypothetical protein DL767_007441 [Monosporascus sp. MG133]